MRFSLDMRFMIESFANFGFGDYEDSYQEGLYQKKGELSLYGYLSLFYGILILFLSNMHALYSHEILCKYCKLYFLYKESICKWNVASCEFYKGMHVKDND